MPQPKKTHHAEAAQLLGVCVGVCAVGQQAGVVPVDDQVNLVLVEQLLQELRGQVIGHACIAAFHRGGLSGRFLLGTEWSRKS